MDRPSEVSGLFYPQSAKDLKTMMANFLKRSGDMSMDCKLIGVVVPHAGYIYSGMTASYSYNLVQRSGSTRFIVIGPKHSGRPFDTYVYPNGRWLTPIGPCEIDSHLLVDLRNSGKYIKESDTAFQNEHSIEVQVPWIQHVTSGKGKILPISMGDQDSSKAIQISEAIQKLKDNFIIIASSDLTHYEDALSVERKDSRMIQAVESLDVDLFYSTIVEENATPCGYGPIAALMHYTSSIGGKIKLLNHSNSGDASGDFSQVVGYVSMVAYME
jgi:AmmeMemoRadiSam system protein B